MDINHIIGCNNLALLYGTKRVQYRYTMGTKRVQLLSPRKAREIRQHRFNLNVRADNEAALHSRLTELAETGAASRWIIDRLIDAMGEVHAEYTGSTREVQQNNTGAIQPHPPSPGIGSQIERRAFNPVPKPGSKSK